jgi:two-component system chemotaxis response regulator CheB
MSRHDIIVVGASAGGLDALQALVGNLPGDLAAAMFVVLHIGARPSALPKILAASGPLSAAHAEDGAPVRSGRIYVAPPDHHLLVEQGHMRLSRGPRENLTRPAVDPLFRSAAEAYGPRVVGVIISGALSDGTAGFSAIKRQGGITIVQDPDEAQYPGMPTSALQFVDVDHCARIATISELLVRLSGPSPSETAVSLSAEAERRQQAKEDKIVSDKYRPEQPVALTCPDCGGSLRETVVDSMPYYTCHIGHRFAGPNMDLGQFERMENALAVALRTLNERAELCRRMAEVSRAKGHIFSTERWESASREAEDRAGVLRRFLEQDWARPGAIEEEVSQEL